MSPVSRKRQKKHRPNPSSNRPPVTPRVSPVGRSALDAVYTDLEDALGDTLAGTDPLDAEILVSELLGSMRGIEDDDPGAPAGMVDAFIDGLASRANPAATAALVVLARLAPGEPSRLRAQRRLQEQAAQELPVPAWSDAIDAWTPGRAMVLADAFGDQATVAVEFAGPGRTHALLAHVDFSHLGGWCPEVFVVEDVVALRAAMARDGAADPVQRYVELELAAARFLVERALAATDITDEPHTAVAFDDMQSLALARLRLLPTTAAATGAATAQVREGLASAGLATPSALDDRDVVDQATREALVQRFLGSTPVTVPVPVPAGTEPAPASVARLARELVDFGCDYDDGRPLRLSPVKLATFLARWLPRRPRLSAADRGALPAVVARWVEFALGEAPLAPAAVAELRSALPGLLEAVTTQSPDEATSQTQGGV